MRSIYMIYCVLCIGTQVLMAVEVRALLYIHIPYGLHTLYTSSIYYMKYVYIHIYILVEDTGVPIYEYASYTPFGIHTNDIILKNEKRKK